MVPDPNDKTNIKKLEKKKIRSPGMTRQYYQYICSEGESQKNDHLFSKEGFENFLHDSKLFEKFDKVHMFSDCCTRQYRCKEYMFYLTNIVLENREKIKIFNFNIFGAGHGENLCDSFFGNLSKQRKRLEAQGIFLVTSDQFVDLIIKKFDKLRNFPCSLYDIPRDKIFVEPMKKISKFHQFKFSTSIENSVECFEFSKFDEGTITLSNYTLEQTVKKGKKKKEKKRLKDLNQSTLNF